MTERRVERTAVRDDDTATPPSADRADPGEAVAGGRRAPRERRARVEATAAPRPPAGRQEVPAPGPAAADPGRPLVGDEDGVPALGRLRHRHRGRRSSSSGACSAPPASGTPSTPPSRTSSATRRPAASTSRTTSAPRASRLHDAGGGGRRGAADGRSRPSARSSTTWPRHCSAASRSPSPRTTDPVSVRPSRRWGSLARRLAHGVDRRRAYSSDG